MSKKILVFGSYVTDLSSRVPNFPIPGQTIKGSEFHLGAGGKGSNQAVAAIRAGADIRLVTKIGGDLLGQQALDFYNEEGLSNDVIVEQDAQTGCALILVDKTTSQNQIVVVSGACDEITKDDENKAAILLEDSDIFLTQLETNIEPVYNLLSIAKDKKILTILNPAPAQIIDQTYMKCIDIIIPNETEAELLTGITVTDIETAGEAAQCLFQQGVQKGVVITLGKQGVYAIFEGEEQLFDAIDCGKAVDTTGAGDAFIGGMTAALADGKTFFEAVKYGNVTAGIAVTRKGTACAMPHKSEIDNYY